MVLRCGVLQDCRCSSSFPLGRHALVGVVGVGMCTNLNYMHYTGTNVTHYMDSIMMMLM